MKFFRWILLVLLCMAALSLVGAGIYFYNYLVETHNEIPKKPDPNVVFKGASADHNAAQIRDLEARSSLLYESIIAKEEELIYNQRIEPQHLIRYQYLNDILDKCIPPGTSFEDASLILKGAGFNVSQGQTYLEQPGHSNETGLLAKMPLSSGFFVGEDIDVTITPSTQRGPAKVRSVVVLFNRLTP